MPEVTTSSAPVDIDQTLESFDRAWQRGTRPALTNYLLPIGHAQRAELLFALVHIDLEYRLKAGDEAPLVESYLRLFATEYRDSEEIVRLIAAEYHARWRREPAVRRDEYLRRFPDHADQLQARLKPRLDCPNPSCRQSIEIAEEEAVTAICRRCGHPVTLRPKSVEASVTWLAAAPSARPGWPSLPGYEILDELGHGGMGVVYKARQFGLLDRVVALKMILSGSLARPEELVRFLKEAEAVARLEHPNVVRIYEVGKHAGQPYFSLEYVDGGSLDKRLAGKPQPPRDAAALTETLARAVHAVHQHGIVHRDLKPGNVLLAHSDQHHGLSLGSRPEYATQFEPKISDFGLAKNLEEGSGGLTATEAVLGTPEYMSPEQAAGKSREIGPSADIYALGVILYEMLIGRPPFRGVTRQETMQLVLTAEPISPRRLQPNVPRDLETICLKCLRKEPDKRYISAEELGDDLRRFLIGEPIVGRPVGWLERTNQWRRRHPVAATVLGLGTLIVLLVVGGVLAYRHQQEASAIAQAETLIDSLASAEVAEVPTIIEKLAPYRRWADPILYRRLAETAPDSKEHLLVRMALAPVSDSQVEFLLQRLLVARPDELLTIRIALGPHKEAVKERLWAVLENRDAGDGQRVRAACALATYDLESSRWSRVGRAVVFELVADRDFAHGPGREALRPIKRLLTDPLLDAYLDRFPPSLPVSALSTYGAMASPVGNWAPLAAAALLRGQIKMKAEARSVALDLLADYAFDQPNVLAELDKESNAQQHAVLLPLLRGHRSRIIDLMRQELQHTIASELPEEHRDRMARRQACAAVTLLQLGHAELVWPHMRHAADPSLRTHLTHELGRRGADVELLLGRLALETDVSARRALILSLGELTEKLLPAQRQRLLALLLGWRQSDPDAGIHSASEWVLGQKFHYEPTAKVLPAMPTSLPVAGAGWCVNQYGHALAVIRGPVEFRMGSVEGERNRYATERPQLVRIPRSFALATKETTVQQFLAFCRDTKRDVKTLKFTPRYSPDADGPIIAVTWYEAAQYCRWLSEKENIPLKEMCYPPIDAIKPGMQLPADCLLRTGYRLPTEAEWEFACRADATTSRYYGSSDALLPFYAHFIHNAEGRTWPVGGLRPNDFGLFDMQGNATEWCQTRWAEEYAAGAAGSIRNDVEDELLTDFSGLRCLRGGSFLSPAPDVRSALRGRNQSALYFDTVGFRIARTWPGGAASK